MTPRARRQTGLIAALVLIVAAMIVFPKFLAFTELAARELRYLWWEIALVALGIWLAVFFKKSGGE